MGERGEASERVRGTVRPLVRKFPLGHHELMSRSVRGPGGSERLWVGGEKQKTKNGRGAGSPGSRAVPVEKKIRNNNNNFSRNQSAQFAQC